MFQIIERFAHAVKFPLTIFCDVTDAQSLDFIQRNVARRFSYIWGILENYLWTTNEFKSLAFFFLFQTD